MPRIEPMLPNLPRFSCALSALVLFALAPSARADERVPAVPKWRRHVVVIAGQTGSGNPFETPLDATFTHAATGTALTLPGYYSGGGMWRVGFMPTELGSWTWSTISQDPTMDGLTGELSCVPSGLPGMLAPDTAHPRKWMLTDAGYEVPIALRMEFFFEPATTAEFVAAADFLKDGVRGHLFETRLTDENAWYGGRTDWIFQGAWQNHQFDLANWDRMEERMEILTERGLGAHVMFYSDDQGKPGWGGQTATEALVIRYVVARLAGYPMVRFSTGIDVSEYRSQAQVNWFGAQLRAIDPYGHPISSRHGGGSGGIVMNGQTYESDGLKTADTPSMVQTFAAAGVPVGFDDAWGENRGSHPEKDHTPQDIRRAFWKCIAAGGAGGLIRGGGDGLPDDGYFSIRKVASDLESEQWLALIKPFVHDRLGETFAAMVPASGLVSGNAYCIADPARDKILVFAPGVHDTYDATNGATITVSLSGLQGTWTPTWFDPRTGAETLVATVTGGAGHALSPPSADDWVLLLERADSVSVRPPSSPQAGLRLTLHPNPFREATGITLEVPGETGTRLAVRARIHDVRGRLVRTILDAELPAGRHTLFWTGEDASGRRVSPGMYFCRVTAGGESVERKTLHVR